MNLGEQTGPRSINNSQLEPAGLPRMNALLFHTPIAPATTPEQNARLKSLFRHVPTPLVPISYFAEVIHRRDLCTGLYDKEKR